MAVRVSGTLGPQEIRVRGTLGLQTGSRCMETTIRSSISSLSTSGNNPRLSYIWMYVRWDIYRDTYLDIWVRRVIIIRFLLWFLPWLLWFLFPVMLPVVIPVMQLWTLILISVILVTFSCYVYHMICNSDSIRLDIRWHEIKVSIWGFPCLDYSFDVLISWDRNLSVYNQSCL